MAWGELATALRRNGLSPDRPPWSALADVSLSAAERDAVLQAIIADLDERGNAATVVRSLCAESVVEARQVALEIIARWPCVDAVLIAWLRPVLRDRRIPSTVLIEGAASLLRTAALTPETTAQILRDFAAGYGRKRMLKRRHSLRQRFGASRAFDRLCADLQRTIPLRCPRCGVRRRPHAMERHLWRRHHLLLVNGRVRSPLRWLDQLTAQSAAERELDTALDLVTRHITARQLKSEDAISVRRGIANRRAAANCPHCSAIVVPSPDARSKSESIRPLSLSRYRISGEGWTIERAMHGIGSFIRVHGPDGGEDAFADGGGRWLPGPAIRWLVLPWVMLAIALAILLPPASAMLGAAIALSGAYAWRLLVRAYAEPASADALVDAAWTRIVQPSLERGEIPWKFVARLATTNTNLGSARVRGSIVRKLVERSQAAEVSGAERVALLGLWTRDVSANDDPLPALLDAISNIFIHDRPMDDLERLADAIPWQEWSVGRRTRLRIGIAQRAFSAGLGVWELIEIGSVIPGFGAWVSADRLERLAQLRGLWLLRSDRGWEECGPAATAFELAANPVHEETLAAAPDLLLDAPIAKYREHVWLRGAGMSFRGKTIHRPESIEVHIRPLGRGYEMRFGSRRFPYDDDPSDLAQTLRNWSQYHFGTLLAATEGALGQPDGAALERLLKSKTMCPECHGKFRAASTV